MEGNRAGLFSMRQGCQSARQNYADYVVQDIDDMVLRNEAFDRQRMTEKPIAHQTTSPQLQSRSQLKATQLKRCTIQ